jgi:hypothetical protein
MSTVIESNELATGIYTDISMEQYLAIPYVHASRLERLRRSPLQYLHSLSQPRVRKSVLERGTALHLAILEPDLFEGHYVILGQCEGTKKDKDRCSNPGILYRSGQSFCGVHDPHKNRPLQTDVELLSQADHDAVLGMREAILSHKRAKTLFDGRGEFEATIIFDDPATGIRCKARPDRLIERAGMYVSIKTTRDASPWAFPKDAENRGHFRSFAFYRRALRAVGWPYQSTTELAVESAAPFDLTCYLPEESEIDSADPEVTRLLRLLSECEATDRWPGYADEFAPLQRPAWAKEQND